MKSNQADQIIVNESDFVEILYRRHDVNHIVVEDSHWIEHYQRMCKFFEIADDVTWEDESLLTKDAYIEECLNDWNLPDSYKEVDIEEYVLSKCQTAKQVARVKTEMKEFKARNMLNVLKFLKYFVDTMKEHNLVWGVGRGSSVASYVLYLLDVHRVDSIEYELDIKEFLK